MHKSGTLDVPVGGLPSRALPFLGEITWQSFRYARPAFGGFVSAAAMGRLLATLADCANGRTGSSSLIESAVLVEALRLGRPPVWDEGLNRVCEFAAGLMKDMRGHLVCKHATPTSLGQVAGWFPSAVMVDLELDVCLAFYVNGVVTDFDELQFVRSTIAESVYRDLGLASS